MGVVYRAEDTVLLRPVALKIITSGLSNEPRGRARILREARAAAALTHPNICTIYEAGELPAGTPLPPGPGADDPPGSLPTGAPYLAMELVEGQTLDALIRERGPFPLPELLDIAVQVSEGLAAAHGRGIVHRDLKPGNVMVTGDRRIKILDFGLARLLAPRPVDTGGSPLLDADSRDLARDGQVLGTLGYVSPERALGRPGASQTDVFSLGVMLYEMASGMRPFRGESTTAVLAKIIEAEPQPLVQLRPDLPPRLAGIITRCLRKTPEERYNDTRDLVVALGEIRERSVRRNEVLEVTAPVPAPPPRQGPVPRQGPATRRMRRVLPWIAGTVLLGAAIAVTLALSHRPPVQGRLRTYRVTETADVKSPAISPDGNFVAFVRMRPGLGDAAFVHDLRTGSELEVYRGGLIGPDLGWAPDGSELALTVNSLTTGRSQTLVVSLLGGQPKIVSNECLGALSWSPDGKRIVGADADGRLAIVDKASGTPTYLNNQERHTWIEGTAWSPQGRLVLLHARNAAGAWEAWILPLDGHREFRLEVPRLVSSCPQWSPFW